MTEDLNAEAEQYRIVGITQAEVSSGMLSRISGAIDQILKNSSAATDNQENIQAKKEWARILFNNPLAHTSEYGSPEYFDVLYINEHAYNLLNSAGIPLKVIDVTTELPKNAGIFLNIPTWL